MNSRLGIIDWGIGGISIYKLIKEKHAHLPVTYFSDTGVTPYGKMARSELVRRLDQVIDFLADQGASKIVIGCNAASTAIPFLKSKIKIEGMIDSGVAASVKMRPTKLGLIGGRRTVVSGVYRKAFADRGIKIEQRVAQPLSGMIENGDTKSPALIAEAKKILSPIKNCSHILLACTHYPAILSVLKGSVSPETQFIDPSFELVSLVKKWKLPSGGKDIFLTSGDPIKMKTAAFNAFGVAIANTGKIQVR